MCLSLLLPGLTGCQLGAATPGVDGATPVNVSPTLPGKLATPAALEVTATLTAPAPLKTTPGLAVSEAAPDMLRELVSGGEGAALSEAANGTDFILTPETRSSSTEDGAVWVYALVAPFPTVADGVTFAELRDVWENRTGKGETPRNLYLSAQTREAFSAVWGPPEGGNIRIANGLEIIDLAWADQNSLAIVPFEEIRPRWKVLQVDGLTPLDPRMDVEAYPLKVKFTWAAASGVVTDLLLPPPPLPETNREAEKITTLVMTGTTALARYTAAKMEEHGVDYPLGDIAGWLQTADITHISNEVSFYTDCPPALPARKESRFCSDPRYIELLAAAGADVIELTGNHNMDWGSEPFVFSLELYRERGFKVYGGGMNLAEARQPLLIEQDGTRLAFIGCNISGPETAWATDLTPGAAPCGMDWLTQEIRRLSSAGYLPVVTFQHYEVDDYQPMNLTRQDFLRAAEAGAVIVSGSQAHFPHGFAFTADPNALRDTFMHYGLGNLFFDQMYGGYRREFIDRHVFYDGRYLGVELLTAMLEDYARPRPMSAEERAQMLSDYFDASGW